MRLEVATAAARPREDRWWPFSPHLRSPHQTGGHGGGDPWPASQRANAKSQEANVVRIDKTGVAREDAREDARSDARAVAGADAGTDAWYDARTVCSSVARSACRAVARSGCGVVPRDNGGTDCGSARGGRDSPLHLSLRGGRRPPWQSQAQAGLEIATAAARPRDDDSARVMSRAGRVRGGLHMYIRLCWRNPGRNLHEMRVCARKSLKTAPPVVLPTVW